MRERRETFLVRPRVTTLRGVNSIELRERDERHECRVAGGPPCMVDLEKVVGALLVGCGAAEAAAAMAASDDDDVEAEGPAGGNG